MVEQTYPFARWGADDSGALPPHAADWLGERLGPLIGATPVPVERITPPAGRLAEAAREAFVDAVGASPVDVSDAGRLAHAGGQSLADVLRRRTGEALGVPDGVVAPTTADEVAAVLAAAERTDTAVVPYGGGTSVVGGLEPERGSHHAVVALDLSGMDRLLAVDPGAGTATFQPGVTGPRADALLQPHGFHIGHVPQSFERASLGGYVATRSAGQASTGYGRLDELVVALKVATPRGEVSLGSGTPNAAGPDLRALFVGSEGTLGVVTELTVRVRPRPTVHRYEMWAFPSLRAGVECARELAQAGIAPTVFRLSDEPETEVTRAQLEGTTASALDGLLRLRRLPEPAFCVLGWEGVDRAETLRRRRATVAGCRRHRAIPLGRSGGEAWRANRFGAPYQRDALLDAGVLAETLETATSWSRLVELYDGVRAALRHSLDAQETPPVVMAHVSHLYPTGASLYFTVLARRLPDLRPALDQWAAAKRAACEAIIAHGGTISHHHAVGRDHAPYLASEIGPVGVAALRAVKRELDPAGICNPGALLPPEEPPASSDSV